MRILVTADLHYDIRRSRRGAEELAAQAVRTGGEAIVLLGDTAGAALEPLRECLGLFERFGGLKFFVPGNHCLWCAGEENSIERYETILPAAVGEEGFVFLDHHPTVLEGLGLVGSVGWYDYSMRDESLGIPLDFYEAKLSPGAARYMGRTDLLDRHQAELTDRHRELLVRWMDGRHVKLGMSDAEFTAKLADKLAHQLAEMAPGVSRIAAFVHHVPFGELVPRGRPDRFAFAAAYMGAEVLGRVLLAEPKVTDAFCGHAHWPMDLTIGHIRARNVGSTYEQKRLMLLET